MPTSFEADITTSGPLVWHKASWDNCNDEWALYVTFLLPTDDDEPPNEILAKLEEVAGTDRLPWLTKHGELWMFDLDWMREAVPGFRFEADDLTSGMFLKPFVRFHDVGEKNFLRRRGRRVELASFVIDSESIRSDSMAVIPPVEISNSLAQFKSNYPQPRQTGFIVMRFGTTTTHKRILKALQDTLKSVGLIGVRADEGQYHDALYYNILTYIYGCGFGVCVFERLESDQFNPNVSLEIGYMLALNKPVCLLKDKTLNVLHSDIVGHLYRNFDPQDPEDTIPSALVGWLRDKRIGAFKDPQMKQN